MARVLLMRLAWLVLPFCQGSRGEMFATYPSVGTGFLTVKEAIIGAKAGLSRDQQSEIAVRAYDPLEE